LENTLQKSTTSMETTTKGKMAAMLSLAADMMNCGKYNMVHALQ
jgi:hypothetical protein